MQAAEVTFPPFGFIDRALRLPVIALGITYFVIDKFLFHLARVVDALTLQ